MERLRQHLDNLAEVSKYNCKNEFLRPTTDQRYPTSEEMMEVLAFSTEGDLRVWRTADQENTYFVAGTFKGQPVKTALPIDNGERCIILLDPDATKIAKFDNLFCIDRSERKIWSAKLPGPGDAFTEISFCPKGIQAYSWSGFSVTINIEDGVAIDSKFTK
jgi:hypothetical protein